jgi:outer membrane protein, heavy metal efflux system
MTLTRIAGFVSLALCVCTPARGQTPPAVPQALAPPSAGAGAGAMALTFEQAMARAKEQAPRVLVARARIDEARGRLAGASVRLQNNPVIETSAGPRSLRGESGASGESGRRKTDFDIGLSQTFELGNRRGARIAAAEAGITRETAQADEAIRAIVQETADAFYRAVFAREQLTTLAEAERVAQDIARVAQRRYTAGDIAVLDVNLAKADASRASARVRIARAAQREAWGDLRRLLGLGRQLDGGAATAAAGQSATGSAASARGAAAEAALQKPFREAFGPGQAPSAERVEPIDVQGELRRLSMQALPDLLTRATAARPELRVLDAEAAEADADVRLGRGLTRPDLGLGVRYGRDSGDQVVIGGLTITLPLFSRGQELEATGVARARRARLERNAARQAIEQDVRTAFDVYQEHRQAVDLLERDALRGLDENEALARRSFDVGQISLPDLLVIRREILNTRLEHLEQQLAATMASLHLEFAAGVLP